MKVILTGATGMIGGEVLTQCIQHPEISSIVVLSRRELPASTFNDPKLKVIILDDFMVYPQHILQDLEGAEACIWCLGGLAWKYPSTDIARKVNVDYTTTAAETWIRSFIPHAPKGSRFRFLYVSGLTVDRDIDKDFWLMADTRRIKGEVINKLGTLGEQHADIFQALFPMPGGVAPRSFGAASIFMAVTKTFRIDKLANLIKCLRVDELAAAMIEIALYGSKTQDILHDDLESRGRALLKESRDKEFVEGDV